jgi:hypothetical protein
MKNWWQSKTVWVNVLTVLMGVVGFMAGHEVIKAHPEFVAVLIAAQGGVNVLLRFFTGKPIKV